MAQLISRSILRQTWLASTLAAIGLFAVGCAHAPTAPATTKGANDSQLAAPLNGGKVDPLGLPIAESSPHTTATASPDAAPGPLDPAAILAEKMKRYADQMTPALEHRQNHQPGREEASTSLQPVEVGSDPEVRVLPRTTQKPLAAKPFRHTHEIPLQVPAPEPIPANQMLAVPASGTANPTAPMQVTPDLLNHTPNAAAAMQPAGDPLEQKLLQHIKEYPHDIWAHLDYELLKFVHQDQDADMKSLVSLPREDRELIQAIVDGLANFRNIVRADPNMLLSDKVQPMLDLANRLRSQASLVIPTLALCTKVDGFGVYEPIEPSRFTGGQDHMVIVYCEVGNFASQLNDHKQWETKLTQETVLYREDGLAIWQDKVKTILDLSRNRRHDFFMVKMIKLPGTLPVGRYLMKVSVQDLQANRTREASVPINIVAQ